jgi:hypothetical protein
MLALQALYHLSHPFSSFCFSYFQIGSLIFAWAGLDSSPPIYTFQVPEMTGIYHHALFIGQDWVSLNSSLSWPQTVILPFYASQVARITCVSHCVQLFYLFIIYFVVLGGVELKALCLLSKCSII